MYNVTAILQAFYFWRDFSGLDEKIIIWNIQINISQGKILLYAVVELRLVRRR